MKPGPRAPPPPAPATPGDDRQIQPLLDQIDVLRRQDQVDSLSGRYVPLALVVLAPVLLNIVAFHIFLAPGTLLIVVPLVAAAIHLAWVQREAFAPLLRSHAPAAAPAGATERGATAVPFR